MSDHRKGSTGPQLANEVSPWEWVAAALSFVLVAGAVTFLGLEAARSDGAPPAIVLEVDSVFPAGAGFLVEFTARNDGEATAAGLHVEATITDADTVVERSETVIDFVPGGAVRRAGLFFTRDPRTHSLQLRPLGYDTP